MDATVTLAVEIEGEELSLSDAFMFLGMLGRLMSQDTVDLDDGVPAALLRRLLEHSGVITFTSSTGDVEIDLGERQVLWSQDTCKVAWM